MADASEPAKEQVAQILLTYHPMTGVLDISATVPNIAVGLDMARRLVDEMKYRLDEAHAAQPKIVRAGAGGLTMSPAGKG